MAEPDDRGRYPTIHAAQLAALIVGDSGRVTGASAEAGHLLGEVDSDLLGRPLSELFPDPEARAAVAPGGPAFDGYVRMAGSTGEMRHRRVWVVPLRSGPTGHGTTDRLVLAMPEESGAQWERATAFLRAIFVQEYFGVSIHDTDMALVATNITTEMFGAPAAGPGERFHDVMRSEDASAIEAMMRRVLDTGEATISESFRMRPLAMPGRQWLLSLSAFRMVDHRGAPFGVILVSQDQTERDRIRRHRAVLHLAADRIGMSLDMAETAQSLADVVYSGGLGDLVTVDVSQSILSGDEPPTAVGALQTSMVRVARAPLHIAYPPDLLPVGGRYPRLPDSPELRQLQRGQPIRLERDRMAVALEGDEVARLLLPSGAQAVLAVPLFARGLMQGSVTVWRYEEGAPFEESDVDLVSEIASRAVLAMDNARRYTRERQAALSLQELLLPQASTDSSAATTAGLYQPAAGHYGIGGDWYDVIPLPSTRVAFVIGDVFGHGLSATATMGRLRTAIHTYATLELDPTEVLGHLDDLVQQLAAETTADRRDTVAAMCLYAVYDPTSGQCGIATAGHHPPLVINPDGSTELVDVRPGAPLGLGSDLFETTSVTLAPGSVLALYTDGIFGIQRFSGDAGLARLRRELAEQIQAGVPLHTIGDALLHGEAATRDDIALLLARTRRVAPDHIAVWDFPAETAAVARARDAVDRQLSAWDLDELAFTTELLVSELVTNAILHASGRIRLRLIRDDDLLICEVGDCSNTQPRVRKARDMDEGGRGLFIVSQCTAKWGCRYGRRGKTIWTEQRLTGASG
ncbi:SpoIIE family protein phosphatase [Streptomyces solisilvae]|uniref:SpoIIE family protein phosphatase n=1 Tax=Streptomyces malaysiensis TaxID=92644 RepID=UPI0036957EC6